jgi:hypothetical protein
VQAVRAFLESVSEEALIKRLDREQVWPLLESPAYDDGMTSVTRIFSELHPDRKRALLNFLAKFYSQQSYTGQRIVATAMLAEFVCHSSEDLPLLRDVIKFLLPRVADKIDKVRKQALRGLGHLVTVWNAETAAMATSVISSLTAAAEDADADVAAEAVLSLTRIAGVVSEDLIGPMLVSICFRLRPAFERKEEKVRGRATTMSWFSDYARFLTSSILIVCEDTSRTPRSQSRMQATGFVVIIAESHALLSLLCDLQVLRVQQQQHPSQRRLSRWSRHLHCIGRSAQDCLNPRTYL